MQAGFHFDVVVASSSFFDIFRCFVCLIQTFFFVKKGPFGEVGDIFFCM